MKRPPGTTAHPASRTAAPGHCRGFSLMELVVVIMLMGILFSAGAVLLGKVFTSYFTARDITDAQWQGLVALERMTRELRLARSATAADLAISTSTQIAFTDINGDAIAYSLNGTALTRSSGGASLALADKMSTLNFFYLQGDGQTTAATAANVSYITVRIRVVDGDYDETLRATVQPRAF